MQTIDGAGRPASAAGPAVTPQGFMAAVTLFLVCQLAGETAVRSLGIALPHFAFPGPVAGMAILFVWLAVRRRIDPTVDAASNGILRNLSLLFVPAAVGIVQYGDVITEFGLALIAALILSTVATLIVTVYAFVWVARRTGSGGQDAA
jgi:holin-like protein